MIQRALRPPMPKSTPADTQRQYQYIQGLVLKSAEKVSEDLYSFKPTPAVRSLAGVLGHIADANMLLCGVASASQSTSTRS